MKKRVWISVSLILLAVPLLIPWGEGHGLEPQEKWVARYNGPGNGDDIASAMAVDKSGNVYVTGFSYGSGTDCDYATIKYDANGKQLWAKRYNGPCNKSDSAYAIAVDKSGNVYVTGDTGYSIGSDTSTDYATIKYNTNGKQLWVARYNGPGNKSDSAYAIAVDKSGNVYVTGKSDYGYATIKYNTNGKQLWVARYSGGGAYAIAVDGSGNIYVTGYSTSGSWDDYATIKYDTNGKQLWVKKYNGPGNFYDSAQAIAVDGSGNVYVTGGSQGSGTWKDFDYSTIKYNTNGKQLWVKKYNGPDKLDDRAGAIAVDGSGNVYVTGTGGSYGTGEDYATLKYNTNGKQLWAKRYNGPYNAWDNAYAIAVDGSGNVYVTGGSKGSERNDDYATIKYDTNGKQLWVKRYNGPGNAGDDANAIAVDGSGNVYIAGGSVGSGTDCDYATIKY